MTIEEPLPHGGRHRPNGSVKPFGLFMRELARGTVLGPFARHGCVKALPWG